MENEKHLNIYSYQFNALFNKVKNIIGSSPINNSDNNDFEILQSSLLFDINGTNFQNFREQEREYIYWVEVYVLKIIKLLLEEKHMKYSENYYYDCNEQHSITIIENNQKTEYYFLYDISNNQPNKTNYFNLANELVSKNPENNSIKIYLLRDGIQYFDIATLINTNKDYNLGIISCYPIVDFFTEFFNTNEYECFRKYVDKFIINCKNIINFKTVITPTSESLKRFKTNKIKMIKEYEYKKICDSRVLGYLSDNDFNKVLHNFLNKTMYNCLISDNDFAMSFITSEWAYDIYFNAMGDLELTGIISGYLKSIEQLLFKITKFHRDENIKIKTKDGFQPYSSDNEDIIDSTLGSLNQFITSKQLNISINKKVRGCLKNAIALWTKYQRNGYFHKHNLFKKDNLISEIRDQTIYLYFLILGGINFTSEQLKLLGIDFSETDEVKKELAYHDLKIWFDNIIKYNLPHETNSLWILCIEDNDIWKIQPFIINNFTMYEFENNLCDFSELVQLNHTYDIPPMEYNKNISNIKNHIEISEMFYKYFDENNDKLNKIKAIILNIDPTQLIYFDENK